MPCGDSTAFPAESFRTVGRALVSKQFSRGLLAPSCDVVCYLESMIPGDDAPNPPVPDGRTFGAGLDEADDGEMERAGNLLQAIADQHEQGGGKAMAAGAFPWATILSAIGPVIQAIILALGKSPIPKPDVK